jgi:hypothetical protein
MPLASAAVCSAHLVAASSLCHPLGTLRLYKPSRRVPDYHHSLLTPPCAYSTSVMPNHSYLDSSPHPAIGMVPLAFHRAPDVHATT